MKYVLISQRMIML